MKRDRDNTVTKQWEVKGMKYINLLGDNIDKNIEEIKRTIDADKDTVFVYSGKDTLYDYITALNNKGKGLDAEYLYKFKVCYEDKGLCISYFKGGRCKTVNSMSGLIHELDGKSSCRIVVENNSRVQLAFIVQQLIFIEYPLENVDILLRKEERDADKTRRFTKNIDELMDGCIRAIRRLEELQHQVEMEDEIDNPTKKDRIKDIEDALRSCNDIKKQLARAIDVELKFAVAASKKAGKSVIVNCFLGEQIAPTSTELATPNNCFYKKSQDKQYHLRLEDSDTIQSFESCDEIYDVIDAYFRKAQNSKEDGFALPNMHIDYVSEENNFSSYTIFDTAGPDAAGTKHAQVAEKAMQMCDVAVFAIDYSKYLTISEEDYLRKVKDIFTKQNKFHSLIFALNKIDVRYTDVDSPKSFVMSVDFLKTRLANIDEAYRDCIIFPTCSLEYFSAIEAEKAGVKELNAENNLPIDDMKKVKFAHKDVPALAWLHTHSENLEYYHGIETISYDVFKKDSGMPALMSYVSYIARSKARDEIVNNVTFEISMQKERLQSILNFIANIEALIYADDNKIREITDIITSYADSVKEIISEDFNEEELRILKEESILRQFNGNYKKVMEHQRNALKRLCDKINIAEMMYSKMLDIIWGKIEKHGEMDGNQINKLFTESDFLSIANMITMARVGDATKETYDQLSKLSREVKVIVDYRQELLRKESDSCRNKLLKENINIELPKQPDFEFATQMPSPGEVIVKVKKSVDFRLYDNLSELFEKKKFFKNFFIWFSKLLGNSTEKEYIRILRADKAEFRKVCEKDLESKFKQAVYENDIAETLWDVMNSSVVDGYMNKLVSELQKVFETMNKTYMFCYDRFMSAIDDREQYKADIELHNKRKYNIQAIGDCTSIFMQIWNEVINDIEDDEEIEPEKCLATV